MSNSHLSVHPNQHDDDATFDVIIVGAGFAGMYMLHRLRKLGFTVRVYEAGSDVGGTWYWNRYPGARCDTESVEYSYSFSNEIQQEWEWSERYPTQPEILRYARYVAQKLDLRSDIEFDTRVVRAAFDEDRSLWAIESDDGQVTTGRFCVMATGCLSTTQRPDFPGIDSFEGESYHTGQWPHAGVDFTGKSVGVIGTGSSGIQSIPIIAEQAKHLYVFQRTPNYSVPAHNASLDPEHVRWIKDNYAELRHRARTSRRGYMVEVNPTRAMDASPAERQREYTKRWDTGGLGFLVSFEDLLWSSESNETAAEFVRDRIREVVDDPDTAEKLLPRDYPIGTKRLCVDSGYFATYNRPNVTLVDVRSAPIEGFTKTGIKTANGEYEVDCVVFATGFDAMTGTLNNIDIRGRGDLRLKDQWADGPETYLGLAVPGFPNLFTITGPGSPSVLSNMMVSIEQHVEWVSACIDYLRSSGFSSFEAEPEAALEWTQHVNDVANSMLFTRGNSWWRGVNVPGKPVGFMPYAGGVGRYRKICEEVAQDGYRGFQLTNERSSVKPDWS